MDNAYQEQAREWFKRGDHDIETAQLLYDDQGYTDSIAYHIHQGLEKYLKGYLVLRGKKPPRIHELDALLTYVSSFDQELTIFLELCEKASKYYIDARYPPGPPVEYSCAAIKSDLELAWEMIRNIRAKIRI